MSKLLQSQLSKSFQAARVNQTPFGCVQRDLRIELAELKDLSDDQIMDGLRGSLSNQGYEDVGANAFPKNPREFRCLWSFNRSTFDDEELEAVTIQLFLYPEDNPDLSL